MLARLLLAAMAVTVVAHPAPAVDPEDLTKYLPDPFNTVAVLNVSNILKSPRAEKEGWAKLDHVEFLAGAIPVSPSIERILLATEIVPTRPGSGQTYAVIPLTKPVDLDRLAKMRGGTVTTVGGEQCVVCPNETNYLVPLGPQIVGALKTDHKPQVSSWMKEAKESKKSPLSQYLNASIYNSGRTNHIFVGMDFEDLLGPKRAKALVDISQTLKGSQEVPHVEAFMHALKGMRFTANIRPDGIQARILIDSGVEPKFKPETMKSFLLEILDRNGAMLEDLIGSVPTNEGKSTILTFKMTDAELAKLMSIFSVPAHNVGDDIPVANGQVSPDATRRYFKAVNAIEEELRKKGVNLDDLAKTALWHETAANKIESMSVIGVDPAVVDYGRGTAGRLHMMAASLSGLPIKGQELDDQVYAIVSPHMYGWGFGGGQMVTQSNYPEIMQKKQKLLKEDTEARNKIWKQVDEAKAKTREAMKATYSGDF